VLLVLVDGDGAVREVGDVRRLSETYAVTAAGEVRPVAGRERRRPAAGGAAGRWVIWRGELAGGWVGLAVVRRGAPTSAGQRPGACGWGTSLG
jgi:hypothetical protein